MMDDTKRSERAGSQSDDGPQPLVPPREDLTARLADLGQRLVLDEHQYWRVPEGWTEAEVRELAAQLGMPLDIMAHGALIAAGAAMPGNRSPLDAGIPRFDFQAVEARHSMRRLNESANRLSRADRLAVLDCQGRGCRRRLGEVVTRPSPGAVTPDGTIEPDWTTDGPVFTIFGPFEREPSRTMGEYRLRGPKESITAPTQSITLRGHRLREDGTLDPAEVPLGPVEKIAIVCGCGYRNIVSLSTLSAIAEAARAAIDGGLTKGPQESEPNRNKR
jgi:hypothetical protein